VIKINYKIRANKIKLLRWALIENMKGNLGKSLKISNAAQKIYIPDMCIKIESWRDSLEDRCFW